MNPHKYPENTPLYESNGLPFSQILADNIGDLKNRIDRKKASLIVIDGGIGSGKTTLAVHIAEYYTILHKGEYQPITYKDQLAMGGVEFSKGLKFVWANNLLVIIYDEAGDYSSRGALTRFNALINRIFDTFRGFKVLVIICLPSFGVLDNDLLDKQIPRLLIHCERDIENDYADFKAYSLYRMYYVKYHMKKLTVPAFAYNKVEPNFQGHFLDLSKKRSDELDKFSTEGKEDILEMAEIKHDGLVDYQRIGLSVNRSADWVKKQVSKLKIKPKKVYKRKNYFEPYVVDVLLNELEKEGK